MLFDSVYSAYSYYASSYSQNEQLKFNPQLILASRQGEIPWEETELIEFTGLSAHFTYIEDWRGERPITFEETRNEEEHTKLIVTYTPPEIINLSLKSIGSELEFVPYISSFRDQVEAKLSYELRTELTTDQPRPIDWFFAQIQHVQDLLALLIGERVQKIRLVITPEKDKSNQVGLPIHIFYAVGTPIPIKKLHPNMILSPNLLGDNLTTIIQAWFRPEWREIWDILGEVFFGVFDRVVEIPRFQLLALTQILESYHRQKLGGEYMDKATYKPFQDEIIRAIPSKIEQGHRQSLKSKIKYGYQYSQRKRLNDLLDLLKIGSQQILGIDKDYINKVVDTRNYFTHYDSDDQTHLLFEEYELILANRRLILMIIALIFQVEMKIPQNLIEHFLGLHKQLGRFQYKD